MERRTFIELLGAAGLMSAFGYGWADDDDERRVVRAQAGVPTFTGAQGRVVVIGGGMGGCSVAKYLRAWGGEGVQVTLVEPSARYVSSIMSNLVLNGQRRIEQLQYGYDALVQNYGIAVRRDTVVAVDPVSRYVLLAGGDALGYDHLVMSPGVRFDLLPGLEPGDYDERFPHAWQGGPQTTLLAQQVMSMRRGDTFVMTIPAAPYRCPPGPYERACVVADWLQRNRGGGRVVVLDANPGITAERHTFETAFRERYGNIIEYVPNAEVEFIDRASRTVVTSLGSWRGEVVNPIPPHRAGVIAEATGLVNVDGRWARVNALDYQSTVPGAEGIHVIGDACDVRSHPKAGHMANAEAKVCADAIQRALRGLAPDPSPKTNSACYSPISRDLASWLTVVFRYDAESGLMTPVPGAAGEAARPTRKNYEQMGHWFNALMGDTFA